MRHPFDLVERGEKQEAGKANRFHHRMLRG